MLLPQRVGAQETSDTNTTLIPTTATKTDIKRPKENLEELRMEKKEGLDKIKSERKSLHEEIKKKRAEIKEQFKEKRAEFKAHLAEIKDARKQKIVEKLDTKLSTVNTNHTNRWAEALEKMEEILSKLTEKANQAKSLGTNTTTAENSIQSAQTAIDQAKNAVTTQAGKEYVLNISDEKLLKNTVGTTVSGLRLDLQSVHKLVIAAKQKVMEAALAVRQLKLNTPTKTILNNE